MRYLLFILVVAAVFVLAGCGEETRENVESTTDALTGLDKVEVGQQSSEDLAVARCQELFQQKFAAGEDMSAGPCISEEIVEGWACDVAHDPREAVDNEEVNQCESYRQGTVSHFVELDQGGNLIMAQ